ncbi:MAG: transposase [Phycisphaerales bacterium]|nr:transposase [Phycisphaerales bacterium]
MGAPYSQDLRDRVLAACDRGLPTKRVSEVFGVSPAWVRRLKQRRRETGETGPRPMGGATIIKIDMTRLAALVQEQPDATLKELRERLGIECAESAICMALQRLGLSFKKRHSTRRSRTARTWRRGVRTGATVSRSVRPAG